MNIEIQIPAETDAKFRERAAAEGRDPADLALKALQEKLGVTDGSSASSGREGRAAAWNRFVAHMHEWTRALPAGHVVDDSREGVYACGSAGRLAACHEAVAGRTDCRGFRAAAWQVLPAGTRLRTCGT